MAEPKIDEGIRPVVEALQAEGFETVASCQGHGEDDAWVVVLPDPAAFAADEAGRLEDAIRDAGWGAHCIVSVESTVDGDPVTALHHIWLKARWWGKVPFRG